MIRFVLPVLLLLAVIYGPQVWARHTLSAHGRRRRSLRQSGAEFARELLDEHGMSHVGVETIEKGDHYDPEAKVVRLAAEEYDPKSLTALVVAAHEVGHSIQDERGYRPLRMRTRLVRVARHVERVGPIVLMLLPIVGALTRAPSVAIPMLIAGVAMLGTPLLVHLVTLPVELDASFKRALPLLAEGRIPKGDLPAARRILTACALTYVAGALASLLNFWRWLAILRR